MAFPSTPILDNFNRSENPLSTGWETALLNSISANGATAQSNASGYSLHIYGTSYTGGQEVYCTITTKGGNGHELALGLMSKESGSLATIDGYSIRLTVASGTDTWSIERVTDGTPTILTSGSQELSNGDVVGIRITASGLLLFFINGTVISSITDTTYTGTGKLSLTIENTTWRVDNFGGGAVSATPIFIHHLRQQGIS